VSSNVFDLIVGASDYVTLDFINALDRVVNNEVVTSVTWDVEDTAVTSYVNSTSAVDAGGRYGSAKFNALAEGVTRVTATATTSNPAATVKEYFFIRVYTPPESVNNDYGGY